MNKITMLLGSAMLLGLVSCNKSEYEGYTKAENGLHYKFFTHDENGLKPVEGDGIRFKYVFRLKSNDSVFVTSADRSEDGSGITNFGMPKSSFVGSIEDAMMMMAANDSASFIVSADSFFLKTNRMTALPPFVKPHDKIQVDIKMVEIITKAKLEENVKQQQAEIAKMAEGEKPRLDAYLAENKITTAPTASGLIIIETKKGTGAKAKAGDQIKVNYTGKLLDGTIFDTSIEADAKSGNVYNPQRPYEPIQFGLGQEPRQVIQGWEEAFLSMSKGAKAKLIIPSSLAYGPRGGGPIPPYATLVFEVELVDITAGASPQAPAH